MKTILALETSCDETAVAILRGARNCWRARWRRKSPRMKNMAESCRRSLRAIISSTRRVCFDRALAAAESRSGSGRLCGDQRTGLASSLMIGASIAKGLALGFGKPYLAINHLEGHLLSPFFERKRPIEPERLAHRQRRAHTARRGASSAITKSSAKRWMTRRRGLRQGGEDAGPRLSRRPGN